MDKKRETKSETREEVSFVDSLTGDHHHVTTISDGSRKVKASGWTSEASQKSASEKWDKKE